MNLHEHRICRLHADMRHDTDDVITFLPPDLDSVQRALEKDKVKALWIESLANPGGAIYDLEALADAAHSVGVPLIVDNTMATPYLCKPVLPSPPHSHMQQ